MWISFLPLSHSYGSASPVVTYSGVVGPEVSQGEVVFVKVTLGQALHDHHIHGFNPPLMVESTPTTRDTGEVLVV